MDEFTLINLEDVTDMAPKFQMEEMGQARFASTPLELQQLGLSFHRMNANQRQPFGHHHDKQEEVYVLTDGSAKVRLDDEVVEMKRWDALRIAPQLTRCIESGPDGAEILMFGCPALSGGENDAEMVQGFWSEEQVAR